MAAEFKVVLANFRFCATEAMEKNLTKQENLGGMNGFLDVAGFLGDWRNPSHLIINASGKAWLVSLSEVEEDFVWLEEPDDEYLTTGVGNVLFCYTGACKSFLLAVKA